MSAPDILSWLKSFGGQADSRAGSLTGDLSQRLTGMKDRMLGTTSPGLSANSAGSFGQQMQWLVDNPAPGSILASLSLGKVFPFTNGTTTDLTINGSDQTVAPTNGVLRYRTITFTTAHTLRITSSRCILMADTIVWNAAGVIACEASGAPALGADPAENFPRGGRAFSTGDAIGGYGGGFLIVLAGTVNGSTVGTLRANGTAGSSNATAAASNTGRGGEGALSTHLTFAAATPRTLFSCDGWVGTTSIQGSFPGIFLSPGGGSAAATDGVGGGAGGGSTTSPGGGSGFGGGGSADTGGAPIAPIGRLNDPDLPSLLCLWTIGVRGGGAGAPVVNTNGALNAAGGGGGGCVVLIVDTETQVSTLTATGGAKAGAAANAVNGGAGYTLRQVI